MTEKKSSGLGIFEKYLTLWVTICIIVGVLIGKFIPSIPSTLSKFEYNSVSIPVAILIWLMIYPMMLKIDFSSVVSAVKKPKGVILTCIINWIIKPFTMYAIAALFFFFIFKGIIPNELAKEYLAGAVLLGAAPCTAMVFVWSHLTKGDSAYTLVQVAVNDLLILVLFAPIVGFLLGVTNISVPMGTLFLSVILFVVIPLVLGVVTRKYVVKVKGKEYFENIFVNKFNNTSMIGLLLTLVITFAFQGQKIIDNPLNIALIAVPLIIQTLLIFGVAYFIAKLLKLPHSIAAPSSLIGASNFFELALAVAISLFGLQSGAVLATVVGVLVEVPVMLALVKVVNGTKKYFN